MTAEVVLTNDGFAVVDDFGPEGRRPVLAGMGPNGPGVLVFASRYHAGVYADTRDAIALSAASSGPYSDTTRTLVERAKQIGRDYGRIVDETDELAGLGNITGRLNLAAARLDPCGELTPGARVELELARRHIDRIAELLAGYTTADEDGDWLEPELEGC